MRPQARYIKTRTDRWSLSFKRRGKIYEIVHVASCCRSRRVVVGVCPAVEKLRMAELALATRRGEEFAKLQAGPNKLKPEQVTALIAAGGNANAGRGGRGGPAAGPAPANGRGN